MAETEIRKARKAGSEKGKEDEKGSGKVKEGSQGEAGEEGEAFGEKGARAHESKSPYPDRAERRRRKEIGGLERGQKAAPAIHPAGADRPRQYSITLSDDLALAVDAFQKAQFIGTVAEAIRRLVVQGLRSTQA